MSDVLEQANDYSASLVTEEARVKRVTQLAAFIPLTLTTGLLVAGLLSQPREPLHYAIGAGVIAAPLVVSAGLASYTRNLYLGLLRQFKTEFMTRAGELRRIAITDELTQLYNRRYFYEYLGEQLAKAESTKKPLALVLIDVDGLKGINDNYGHWVGDGVIARVAQAISSLTRTADLPARLGGDEFGVIMPEADKNGAFALARRLSTTLEEDPAYEGDGLRLHVNVSIGVSGYPWGGTDVDSVMRLADMDMYTNKVSRKLAGSDLLKEDRPADLSKAADFDWQYRG